MKTVFTSRSIKHAISSIQIRRGMLLSRRKGQLHVEYAKKDTYTSIIAIADGPVRCAAVQNSRLVYFMCREQALFIVIVIIFMH